MQKVGQGTKVINIKCTVNKTPVAVGLLKLVGALPSTLVGQDSPKDVAPGLGSTLLGYLGVSFLPITPKDLCSSQNMELSKGLR